MPKHITEIEQLEEKTFNVDEKVGSTTNSQMGGKRRGHELIYVILKAVQAEDRITRILKRADINNAQWKKHKFLIDKGYINEDTKDVTTYSLGKKGEAYIEWFDSGIKALGCDPDIFPEKNIQLKKIEIEEKSVKRKIISYKYRGRILNILKELSQIDRKKVKRVLRDVYNYSPALPGYCIQISPSISLILRLGKHPSFEILGKIPDSTDYSIIYRSAYSPVEVLDDLSTEIKEIIKTLKELKNEAKRRAVLPTSVPEPVIFSKKYEKVPSTTIMSPEKDIKVVEETVCVVAPHSSKSEPVAPQEDYSFFDGSGVNFERLLNSRDSEVRNWAKELYQKRKTMTDQKYISFVRDIQSEAIAYHDITCERKPITSCISNCDIWKLLHLCLYIIGQKN